MKNCSVLMALLLSMALLTGGLVEANEVHTTPNVYGKTIGNWGQAWWQWALNFSAAEIPVSQTGNVDCAAGQSGKVWFLAGTFGGSADRTCVIDRGRALFFPLLNNIYIAPEDCTSVLGCRASVATRIDPITSWKCTVDDTPCVFRTQIVRAQSNPLPIDIPIGSIAATPDWGYSAGMHDLSIADGYWVMLDPLPRGQHTVHFTAVKEVSNFSIDVTYHLTVK